MLTLSVWGDWRNTQRLCGSEESLTFPGATKESLPFSKKSFPKHCDDDDITLKKSRGLILAGGCQEALLVPLCRSRAVAAAAAAEHNSRDTNSSPL